MRKVCGLELMVTSESLCVLMLRFCIQALRGKMQMQRVLEYRSEREMFSRGYHTIQFRLIQETLEDGCIPISSPAQLQVSASDIVSTSLFTLPIPNGLISSFTRLRSSMPSDGSQLIVLQCDTLRSFEGRKKSVIAPTVGCGIDDRLPKTLPPAISRDSESYDLFNTSASPLIYYIRSRKASRPFLIALKLTRQKSGL
jgi:hypothetical protein